MANIIGKGLVDDCRMHFCCLNCAFEGDENINNWRNKVCCPWFRLHFLLWLVIYSCSLCNCGEAMLKRNTKLKSAETPINQRAAAKKSPLDLLQSPYISLFCCNSKLHIIFFLREKKIIASPKHEEGSWVIGKSLACDLFVLTGLVSGMAASGWWHAGSNQWHANIALACTHIS